MAFSIALSMSAMRSAMLGVDIETVPLFDMDGGQRSGLGIHINVDIPNTRGDMVLPTGTTGGTIVHVR